MYEIFFFYFDILAPIVIVHTDELNILLTDQRGILNRPVYVVTGIGVLVVGLYAGHDAVVARHALPGLLHLPGRGSQDVVDRGVRAATLLGLPPPAHLLRSHHRLLVQVDLM